MKSALIQVSIAGVVLVLALGAYVFTFREVSSLQEESFLLAQEIESAQTKERRISRAENVLGTVLMQEERIQNRFVNADTLVEFLESLERIEDRSGAAIEVLSVSTDDAGAHFTIKVTVEGSFSGVMRTVGAINNLPVFLTLTNGTVDTIVRGENDPATWTASLSYEIGTLK